MVEALHLVERVGDLLLHRLDPRGPRLGIGRQPVLAGVEPGREQLDQQPGQLDVVAQRVLHVVQGEGRVALLHVLRVGAQDRRLAPGEARVEHETVEAVDLVEALPHGAQGVLEELPRLLRQLLPVAQAELVDERRPAEALELVGPLVDHLDAHRREHRQDLRQRQRRTDPEHLEPGLPTSGVHLLVEGEVDAVLLPERLQAPEVVGTRRRQVVLLVGLGERVDVAPGEARAGVLAVLGDRRREEVVAPGSGGLREPTFEVALVDLGDDPLPLRRVDDEVDVGGGGLPHPGAELDALAAELLLEDRAELLAHRGAVAVTWQVDQHRHVAPVGVAAEEHPDLAAPAGVHDRLGHRRELVDRGLEQLVARIGLEGVHERLAGVAARVEADPSQHLGGLLPQQRDPGQRLGVGRAGEEPEDPSLADDLAVLVEPFDPDVVEVGRPMHRRAGVGLGEHEQGLLPGLRLDRSRQLAEGARHVLVGAQDAQAGAGQTAQHLVLALGLEAVLPVAEEGEVVVGEPAEEILALFDLGLGQGRGVGVELVDDREHLGLHLLPVLDRLAHVTQDLLQQLLDLAGVLVVCHPGDLDVHPRLAEPLVGLRRTVVGELHLPQLSGDVADDVELRMDHGVHVALLAGELHRQRVDQERHVVGDDLDDRVTAGGPAVLGGGRGERPHLRRTLRPAAREPVVGGECTVEVDVGAVGDVLGSHVPVVGVQQGLDHVVRRPAVAPPMTGHLDRSGKEFRLFPVERGGHPPDTRTRS